VTDHDCSKAAILIPCNKSITTEGTAELYTRHIVPHYGIPTRVISDRDPHFRVAFTKGLCKVFNISQNISSTNHPQTDRQSKCTNQGMEQYLRTVTNKDQHNWARWIPLTQYVRNSWVNSTTKKTPYELILGYTPKIHQPKRITALPGLTNRMEQLQKHREEAQDAMKTVQQRLVKESNFKPFQVNNRVWLEGTNLNLPYLTKKLAPRRFGPFKVVAKISDVAYRLELPPKWKIHNSFHTSLLTPYKEMEKHSLNFLEPPPDIIEGELEWEVEQILDHQQVWNKAQYLIRWKDYSPAHDSWESESDINAPTLLSNYLTKLAHSASQIAQQSKKTEGLRNTVQNTPKGITPMAKRMQELQKPGNQVTQTWPNGKQNSPSVSSTVNTRQLWSSMKGSTRKMYIRTVHFEDEEAATEPSSMSFLLTPSPTPSSPTPSCNDTNERGGSIDSRRLAPPHRPTHYPARPGSTHPVTPQSEGTGGNGSRDNGSNWNNGDALDSDKEKDWAPFSSINDNDKDTDNDSYCATNLHLLWRLANSARKYWLANKGWPRGLDEHSLGIFHICATP
jgi:Chromo (CHRromatin Organisation MOdifier) domain